MSSIAYVARRRFKGNGTTYLPGQPFDASGVEPKRLDLLRAQRFISFANEPAGDNDFLYALPRGDEDGQAPENGHAPEDGQQSPEDGQQSLEDGQAPEDGQQSPGNGPQETGVFLSDLPRKDLVALSQSVGLPTYGTREQVLSRLNANGYERASIATE